jgi:hypothetical protein
VLCFQLAISAFVARHLKKMSGLNQSSLRLQLEKATAPVAWRLGPPG